MMFLYVCVVMNMIDRLKKKTYIYILDIIYTVCNISTTINYLESRLPDFFSHFANMP